MAWGSRGQLGASTATASAAVFTFTTQTTTVLPGDVVVLAIAVDNVVTVATTPVEVTQVSGINDGQNAWTRIAEYGVGDSSATFAGAVGALWYTVASATMTVGRAISVSFTANTALPGATVVSGWAFTKDSGATVSVQGYTATGGAAIDYRTSAAYADLTTPNAEFLRIAWRAIEENTDANNASTTTNWTKLVCRTAANSGPSGNSMMGAGEFRISTATSDQSQQTLTFAGVDGVNLYCALKQEVVSTNKTVTAEAGSYVVTGTDVSLEHGWEVAADAGSYAVTGTDASLEHGWEVAPDSGSYAVTGTDASLEHDWKIVPDAGSYAVTGTDVTFNKGQTVALDPGSYAVTGTDASLEHGWEVAPDAGSYAVTGTDMRPFYGYEVSAVAGSYAVTGTDASLEHGKELAPDSGSYAVTGTDASLEHGKEVAPDSGAYAVTGTDVTFLKSGGSKSFAADPGSYAVTGTDASLEHGWEIAPDSGSYAVTGTDASLEHGWEVTADAGSYAVTGTDVGLTVGYRIAAAAGAYSVNGIDVDFIKTDLSASQVSAPLGGGGKWQRRESGLYWPKKITKKVVEEIIEEVIEEITPDNYAGAIDVGALAQRVMATHSPEMIRELAEREQFIAVIVRELEEQDDEEVIMWLLDD